MLPKIGSIRRYKILEWLNYISTELHKTSGLLFSPVMPQDVKDSIVKPLLKKKLDFVNGTLKNKFLAGDEFTLPDSYLFVILFWLPKFNMDVTDWQNLANYFAKLKERNSVHQSLKEESLLE